MLDIDEINNTIEELLNGSTTFDNVLKLASLYIVKEHIQNANMSPLDVSKTVLKELDDILPAYTEYKRVKKEYQVRNVTKDKVILQMEQVCKEISEFIHTLYNNTECEECRNLIENTVKSLDF